MRKPVSKTALDPEVVLLTVPEVAHLLRMGRTKVWYLVRLGDIPSIRLGKSVRVPRAELLRWVEAQPRA